MNLDTSLSSDLDSWTTSRVSMKYFYYFYCFIATSINLFNITSLILVRGEVVSTSYTHVSLFMYVPFSH